MFDYKGKRVRQFGQEGKEDEQLSSPYCIAFDNDNNIYVCDFFCGRVCVVAADGSFITAFAFGAHEMPYSVCVSADHRVVIGCGESVVVAAFEAVFDL